MIVRSDFARIKERLDSMVGQEIRLTIHRGKQRTWVRHGIIENTYSNIFIVKIMNPKSNLPVRRISYSYADILIGFVEITPLSKEA